MATVVPLVVVSSGASATVSLRRRTGGSGCPGLHQIYGVERLYRDALRAGA